MAGAVQAETLDGAPSGQPFISTESKTIETYADGLRKLGSEATEGPETAGQLIPAGKPTDPLVLEDELLDLGAPSLYVVADSPAEAERLLDLLEEGALSGRPATSSTTAARVQYGPCTLTPSSVYLRTSSGKKAVGFKSITKCSVPVAKIHHSTDLRHKWGVWWRHKVTITGQNSGVASYTQKNVAWKCKGADSTTWSATTLGTITYKSKRYYARVYAAPRVLACAD